ncbi:hypothetical protein [Paenibacillus soyae]|uniref:hypothetical protein n=1 Tax=Paenibacillus soyae TaxID=2969249 RepID=UPI003530492C
MKLNKRWIWESLAVALLVVLGWVGWNVYQGYVLTYNYVPDIINQYESVDNLQHQVSFGTIPRFDFLSWITVAAAFLLLAAVYYFGRFAISTIWHRRKR